ncbi:hypothetical protein CVIRNUC_009855 [Coccomyxa viridis]|uniref:Uncharacterized protein n=1 Tax=Coccomyxa viridis TaxID=1274662 RepID=A0AAV1IIK1_9CHLO|nr:hypothetical protein CVIRNUC_009855 [Coccomyxa viridis]
MTAARASFRKSTSFRAVLDVVDRSSRTLQRLGSFSLRRNKPTRWGTIGVRKTLADDVTFRLFDMEWASLIFIVVALYMCVSAVFAIFFWAILVMHEGVSDDLLGDFSHISVAEGCFWLSVTNLVTIGYGSISPSTRVGYTLCTVEHFAGLMMSSCLLGIVFARASIPTAKMAFSKVCLITTRNGKPHLLVRIGNTRGNFLLHPEIRISYFQKLVTYEGESTMKGQRCEVVDHTALAPSLVISHEITETSPLHGLSIEDIQAANGAIFVSVAATDDNHLQSVYARTIYRPSDILFNRRYQDVLVSQNGRQFVDFARFHETLPIDEKPPPQTLQGDVQEPVTPTRSRSRSPDQAKMQHADILGHFNELAKAETDDALLTREEQLMSCKSLPALGISREDLRRRMISSLKPIAEKDEGSLGSRRLGAIQECPT